MTQLPMVAFLLYTVIQPSLQINKSLSPHLPGSCTEQHTVQSVVNLLQNYDRHILPQRSAVKVYIDLNVQDISHISDLTGEFGMDLIFSEIWRDRRLSFENTSICRSNITSRAQQYKNMIWTPDTCIANSKKSAVHFSPVENTFVILYRNGTVRQNHRLSVIAPCRSDLRSFPFDVQKCYVKLEASSYNIKEVRLHWYRRPQIFTWKNQLPDFELVELIFDRSQSQYPNGGWDQLMLTFVFKRRFGFYISQAYFPTTMTLVASWTSFFLESRALSARITLQLNCLLALTFQLGNVLRHLPRVSYIKFIDVWMMTCVIFLFCSLVELAIVSRLQRYSRLNKLGKTTISTRQKDINRGKHAENEDSKMKNKISLLDVIKKRVSSLPYDLGRISGRSDSSFPLVENRKTAYAGREICHRDYQQTNAIETIAEFPFVSDSELETSSLMEKGSQVTLGDREKTENASYPKFVFNIDFKKLTPEQVDSACMKLFPSAFILFNVFYWFYLLLLV